MHLCEIIVYRVHAICIYYYYYYFSICAARVRRDSLGEKERESESWLAYKEGGLILFWR